MGEGAVCGSCGRARCGRTWGGTPQALDSGTAGAVAERRRRNPRSRGEAPRPARRSSVRSGWGQRYRRAVRICSTTPVSRLCSRVSRVTRLSKASRSARASVRKRVTCLSKASRSARASSRRLYASACQASRSARAPVRKRVTCLSKASRSARASTRKRVTRLSKASRSARASSRRLCASACQASRSARAPVRKRVTCLSKASRPARAPVRSLPVALPLPPVGAEVYRRSLLHRAAHEPRRPLTPLLGRGLVAAPSHRGLFPLRGDMSLPALPGLFELDRFVDVVVHFRQLPQQLLHASAASRVQFVQEP